MCLYVCLPLSHYHSPCLSFRFNSMQGSEVIPEQMFHTWFYGQSAPAGHQRKPLPESRSLWVPQNNIVLYSKQIALPRNWLSWTCCVGLVRMHKQTILFELKQANVCMCASESQCLHFSLDSTYEWLGACINVFANLANLRKVCKKAHKRLFGTQLWISGKHTYCIYTTT